MGVVGEVFAELWRDELRADFESGNPPTTSMLQPAALRSPIT